MTTKKNTLTKIELALTIGLGIFAGLTGFILVKNVAYKKPATEAKIASSTVTITPIANDKAIINNDATIDENSSPVERSVQNNKSVKLMELPYKRTLSLRGVVSGNAVEMAYQIAELSRQSKDPIYIVIDSPGGSVLAGAILISAMQASQAPIHTICHSICASMAAMIHQYGDKRYSVDRSILMFHPASGGAEGDIDRMKSMTDMLQGYINKLEKDVSNRLGLGFDKYKALTSTELWWDSDEQLKRNATDGLVDIHISAPVGLFQEESSEGRNVYYSNSIQKEFLLGKDVIWIMPGVKYQVK